ncbi:Uncharacterised protein [Enterobacter cloacae]|uniref:Uncharacterized protein n=1 Tax=Enterobacter cloacae TaxID=550 RepID=A0A0M7FVP4_ENTCL|nr:hypothetical protein DR74_4343 [Enterobacter cloacae]CUI86571.1 Uncharacterised protein [Enterobacter cloacae]STQ11449.1 Uncharacterised protein [Enterobacter cloacae]
MQNTEVMTTIKLSGVLGKLFGMILTRHFRTAFVS